MGLYTHGLNILQHKECLNVPKLVVLELNGIPELTRNTLVCHDIPEEQNVHVCHANH